MNLETADVSRSADALRESLAEETPTPLIITRDGKPIAALVPTPNADLETATLSLDPGFLSLIERSRQSLRAEDGVSAEDMELLFR